MLILKNIAGRIWAIWALVWFIVTFLLIFPFSMIAYLIPDPMGQRYFIIVSRIWMMIWLPLVGCPVRVKGWQHFQKGKSYIILFNHNALLDVPLSAPFVPGPNKTIAKDSFARVPLFGWFYSKGSVLVNRKSEQSRKKSFLEMKNVLQRGMHMCIYPEGTRNRTSAPLKPFYDGAFKLSIDSGHSIIPCVIFGTKEAMPTHIPFYLLPHILRMEFMEPISPEGKTVESLKNISYQRMLEKYSRK
ncbi:MAG TPA: lysophospholipid acyltransferase family protein [Ferruginibacter sp.]|nr:1-acyl-sn-glycerol-3-phosphate acyltransferase [Chitinophagaceae bacterium]HML58268.1 lysophospholipid acyltransferase family protein [Ferruginibacter sp.]HRN91899.1 lysophospholipid acyltransferase family protein [Ferruginibacter sp.]HRO05578.1 lysophospholipid acyltransferase family protein [Ferruginibacter sp.]HRO97215.1 lysophospholipid acyltransferase family protein [Ferruginibacter sp.]